MIWMWCGAAIMNVAREPDHFTQGWHLSFGDYNRLAKVPALAVMQAGAVFHLMAPSVLSRVVVLRTITPLALS